MHNFFVEKNQIHQDNIEIIGDDIKHIKNVLRFQIGDKIQVNEINSQAKTKYLCEISKMKK